MLKAGPPPGGRPKGVVAGSATPRWAVKAPRPVRARRLLRCRGPVGAEDLPEGQAVPRARRLGEGKRAGDQVQPAVAEEVPDRTGDVVAIVLGERVPDERPRGGLFQQDDG